MTRNFAIACVALGAVLSLSACGGGSKGGGKDEDQKVALSSVSHYGATLKVPQSFKKVQGSTTYNLRGGTALIAVDKIQLKEGASLEEYYASEFLKRQKETQKRMKSAEAYKILHKNDFSIGGKKAIEVEQEFESGSGTQKSHNIVVLVALAETEILTVTWEVPDLNAIKWHKAHSTYFKESRASLDVK